MTAAKQPRHARVMLPATDAEIMAWFVSMVQADQYPSVVNYGPITDARGVIKRLDKNQMAPLGREYQGTDADRWWWMRDHEQAVEAWLIAHGLIARLDSDNHPSSATLIVMGQELARKGGAK